MFELVVQVFEDYQNIGLAPEVLQERQDVISEL